MPQPLNPLAAFAAAVLVSGALGGVFLCLLATGPAGAATLALVDTHATAGWMASCAPCALLLAVLGAGGLLGAAFRSPRRVGAAVRVSMRPEACAAVASRGAAR